MSQVILPQVCLSCRRVCPTQLWNTDPVLLCGACELQLLESVDLTIRSPGYIAMFRHWPLAGAIVRAGKDGGVRAAVEAIDRYSLQALRCSLPSAIQARRLAQSCAIVTWIPPDRHRAQHRGYHVPELWARRLATHLGLPAAGLLQSNSLRSQRGLSRGERLENALRSMRPMLGLAIPRGAQILVVDDVTTTGATFSAASQLLAGFQARTVCLAFSTAPRLFPVPRNPAVHREETASNSKFVDFAGSNQPGGSTAPHSSLQTADT